MSNIIPFNTGGNALPAHLADVFGDSGNIAPRITTNQLSVKGKVWRRIVDGEETQLTKRDSETGDQIPLSIVNLIVLDQNRSRSRSYHPNGYTEGKNEAPTCASNDGITPDADIKEPCAATCASCPNSVKGSKVTEAGAATTACVPYKRIAVVPTSGVTTHPVMLLKIAQTSIWDKDNGENEAQGWYAWDQYTDMLRARGAKHTAAVETKVKFDLRVAYPKLLFCAARWLNADEAQAAKARLDADAEVIKTIINGSPARDGVTGAPSPAYVAAQAAAPQANPVDATAAAEAAFAARQAAEAAAAAKAAAERKAAKVAAANKAAADAAAAAAAAAKAAEDDDEGDAFGTAPPAPAPAPAPAARAAAKGEPPAVKATPAATPPAVGGTPAGLADLLNGWDA